MQRKEKILCALLLLNILFIWGNSMLPSDVSNVISTPMTNWLDNAVEKKETAKKEQKGSETQKENADKDKKDNTASQSTEAPKAEETEKSDDKQDSTASQSTEVPKADEETEKNDDKQDSTVSQSTEVPKADVKKHEVLSLPFLKVRTHRFVRKCAHILEFILLGLWCALLLLRRVKRQTALQALALIGLLVPLIDETIQVFSKRTSLVGDIWLDLLSFAIGVLAAALILFCKRKKQ